METWKEFLRNEYVSSFNTENWFEKYPEYEDDIEENKKFLINLLDDDLDVTEAFYEYLEILPKCYKYFMCMDDDTKEALLNIFIENNADTTNVLDYINVDFKIIDSFENSIRDYNIRGWLLSYFLKNDIITIDDIDSYFECNWLLIEPEYWEDIDDPEDDIKVSCLKYLKYCSLLFISNI